MPLAFTVPPLHHSNAPTLQRSLDNPLTRLYSAAESSATVAVLVEIDLLVQLNGRGYGR